MSLSETRQGELMQIIDRVYDSVAPEDLHNYAESQGEVERLIGEHLIIEEWDFVQTELRGIVETDPLCSGVPAPEGMYCDDDAVDPEEFDPDLTDPDFETDF